MIWVQFGATALVIVVAGVRLAPTETCSAKSIAALDLGIGNVLGSNLFNLLILGLDDVFYRPGPLITDAGAGHSITVVAIVMMNALFLIGLTYKVLTKRFLVTWDSAAIGGVYALAVVLSYLLRG